uniref:G-protein coupled receptors family 1 profile domain-containing protein n=1 Tax=Strongyloides stercoralis TaxID=6248 RepID=A0A913IBI4_STRER
MVNGFFSNYKELQYKLKLSDILSIYISFIVNILCLVVIRYYKCKNEFKIYKTLVQCQFIYGMIFSFFNIFARFYCLSSDGYFICGFQISFIKPPNINGTLILYFFYFCLLNHCILSTISIGTYRYLKICKNVVKDSFLTNILLHFPLIISYVVNISIILAYIPQLHRKENIIHVLRKHNFNYPNMTATFSEFVYSRNNDILFMFHMLLFSTFYMVIYLFFLYIHLKIKISLRESVIIGEFTKRLQRNFSTLLCLQIFCPCFFFILPITIFCLFCTFGGETYFFPSILIRSLNWFPTLNGFIYLFAPTKNREFITKKLKLIFMLSFSSNSLKHNSSVINTIRRLDYNTNHKCV